MNGSPLRVLVTGARTTTYAQEVYVGERLAFITAPARSAGRPVVIVEGRCKTGGVDQAARLWAELTPGVTGESHPADWARYRKGAGPKRNAAMVALGADLCVAFPGRDSVGTWDCLKQAALAGIPGRVYPLPTT